MFYSKSNLIPSTALATLFALAGLCFEAAATSGRTNAQGCHNSAQAIGYHCHEKPEVEAKAITSEEKDYNLCEANYDSNQAAAEDTVCDESEKQPITD